MDVYRLNHSGLKYVIYVTTTTNMKTLSKLAILESLDTMDHAQMEKVMAFIREILRQETRPHDRNRRQQAMEQIRKALQPHQVLQPKF